MENSKHHNCRPIADRFWEKINKTDTCWLWTGACVGNTKKQPRPTIWYNGKNKMASHVSWELEHGETFPKGLFALHHCDVSLCVNPAHLFVGTYQDNEDDKRSKDRHLYGSRHHQAVLGEEDIPVILVRLKAGETCQEIGDSFGVSKYAIHDIASGRSWTHITQGARIRNKSGAKPKLDAETQQQIKEEKGTIKEIAKSTESTRDSAEHTNMASKLAKTKRRGTTNDQQLQDRTEDTRNRTERQAGIISVVYRRTILLR